MAKRAEQSCKIEGCSRPYRAKGYCRVHYQQWRKGTLGKARYKICTQENCRKPMYRRGMCEEHYNLSLKSRQKTSKVAAPEKQEEAAAEKQEEAVSEESPAQESAEAGSEDQDASEESA